MSGEDGVPGERGNSRVWWSENRGRSAAGSKIPGIGMAVLRRGQSRRGTRGRSPGWIVVSRIGGPREHRQAGLGDRGRCDGEMGVVRPVFNGEVYPAVPGALRAPGIVGRTAGHPKWRPGASGLKWPVQADCRRGHPEVVASVARQSPAPV
jgi:hypothetical protein